MLESELQAQIIIFCKAHDLIAVKLSPDGDNGIMDLLVLGDDDLILFIEVKHPNKSGRLRKLQERYARIFKRRRISHYVADDYAETAKALIRRFRI